MTTHEQNKNAIREGQQGGPAQKNQAVQGALGSERDLKANTGVQPPGGSSQQATNPGQTGTPGGKGKQDASQNQKR